jgi:hypothetical protein
MTIRSLARRRPVNALTKLIWTVLLLGFTQSLHSQQADVKEVKKEADRRFDDEDYDGAYKLYSQLVANFPKDPVFNYRLGVCMIYSEPDKKKALPYLKSAAANPEAPKEAVFYLGKALHINYRFDEAIAQYEKFKTTASTSVQKKLGVDREIAACRNGKKLLSNLTDLVVLSKKVLNENDYFRSYDLKSIGGKLLAKPEEFKTALDKKKKDRSVIFLPRGGDVVFFSSYGETGETGRDIYTVQRNVTGGFGKPQVVPGINTADDEDYPFLHPDGKSLYFASKGRNSMGGYDIFRSVWDENANAWGQPVNLEFPINSPDDDFLFVTDSLEQTAFFSTGRQSAPGKIDVLKINTERKPADVLILAGTVEQGSETQSVESSILVRDVTTGKDLTLVNAEPTGDYVLEVPNGGKLLFKVTTPGLNTQSEEVQMPLAKTATSYRQTITYENGKLKITNDFDTPAGDDAYLKMLAVIEKKAKLDVNEGQNKLQMPQLVGEPDVAKNTETRTVTSTAPVIVQEEKSTAPATVDNKELAKVARQDAVESQQEAVQLEKDAAEALSTGEEQKIIADNKLTAAAQALLAAEKIEDRDKRKEAVTIATKQKEDAKYEQGIAEKVIALAHSLENDAKNKKQVASLNTRYANELDKAVVSANPATLKNLEDLRRQIDELDAKDKGKEEQNAEIIKTIAEKEGQVAQIDKVNEGLRVDLAENANAISAKEKELENTRKKSRKAEISAEIDNLKAERAEKEKELANNETEAAALRTDILNLQVELDPKLAMASNTSGKESPSPVPQENTPSEETSPTAAPTYQAITSTDPMVADRQLAELDKRISEDQDKTPPTEAFTDLRNARQKLKDEIARARSAVSNTAPVQTSAQQVATLSREADDLMSEAQQLRTEARAASGAQKEEKNKKAKEKEEAANEKLIEAGGITATENYNRYNTGAENLENLISAGSRQTTARLEAQRLNEESQLAFRQAAEIRA